MKLNRVIQILAGFTFFILAVFFSFSLLFSLFQPTSEVATFSSFMVKTGSLLKKTYGICSILIPIFFFVVSMICFIAQVTFKTCIYISFSLIPFFTAVLSEHLYKNSLNNLEGPIVIVKLIITIISTILIMGIEILLSGIIAERIAFTIKKKKSLEKKTTPDEITITEYSPESEKAQINIEDPYIREFDNISLYENSLTEDDFETNIDSSDLESELNNYNTLIQSQSEDDTILEFNPEELEKEAQALDNDYFDTESNDNYLDIESDSIDDNSNLEEFDSINDSNSFNNFESLNASDNDFNSIGNQEDFDNDSDFDFNSFDNELELDDDSTSNFSSSEPTEFEDNYHDIESDIIDDDTILNDFNSAEPNDNTSNFDITTYEQIDKTLHTDIDKSHGLTGIFSQMDQDIRNKVLSDSQQDNFPKQQSTISVKEAEEEIKKERESNRTRHKGPYKIPTENLLNEFEDQKYWVIDSKTNDAASQLKETLEEFKIEAEVTGIRKGPVVTMFEILPAPGVKLSKIVALQDNIALRLAASSVRIVAPIPGKRAVGIEVPNEDRATVTFRELIEQNLPEYKKMAVPVVLGKDIQGEAQLLDIARTPHLLIAGSTGSGKSVCVNSIILSILYKRSPDEVKLILVDPKIVELKLYNDIPHLLTPVITEPKLALQSLQYCLCEMERRYALLDGLGVRDIISYNKRIEERKIATEKLPYIVVIIDEFADLMATTGKELESTIARLCAMSRAVGIHLVLATQRPSIDVITGLIKANIPTRIAFMVASKMDSRIIIDQVGAEKLLGRGDMLYASATDPFPVRIQGTYVSDQEVENVVDYVKGFGEPEYIDDEIFVDDDDESSEPSLFGDGDDPLYNKALEIVLEAGKASASYLQRRLKIGYNRAARLVEEMEARGIVGPANGSKPREIIHIP